MEDFSNQLTALPSTTTLDIISGDFNIYIDHLSSGLALHLGLFLKITCAQMLPWPRDTGLISQDLISQDIFSKTPRLI